MSVLEAKVQGLDHLYSRFILRKYGTSKVLVWSRPSLAFRAYDSFNSSPVKRLNSFSLSFCAFSCELHCMVGLSFHPIPFISAWLLASGELGSILNEMDVAPNFLDLDVEVKYYFRYPFSSFETILFSQVFFKSLSSAMLAWSLPLFQSRIWSFPAFMRSLKRSSSFLDFMLTGFSSPGVYLTCLHSFLRSLVW